MVVIHPRTTHRPVRDHTLCRLFMCAVFSIISHQLTESTPPSAKNKFCVLRYCFSIKLIGLPRRILVMLKDALCDICKDTFEDIEAAGPRGIKHHKSLKRLRDEAWWLKLVLYVL